MPRAARPILFLTEHELTIAALLVGNDEGEARRGHEGERAGKRVDSVAGRALRRMRDRLDRYMRPFGERLERGEGTRTSVVR